MSSKTCSKCKINKKYSEFYKNTSKKDALCSTCKDCEKQRDTKRDRKEYRKQQRIEKGISPRVFRNFTSSYDCHLWNTYGIREEDYKKMLYNQKCKCKICEKDAKLVVDHCHGTGKIRGLICENCNKGLGLLGDTKECLTKALIYLS